MEFLIINGMKKLIFLVCVIGISSCSAKAQSKVENRELLKEYFLCCCIHYGFNSLKIDTIDHSASTYFDILPYELPAMQKVDSLANSFVSSIEISGYENRKTKGIIILSIEKYKSRNLDDFIKTMDKYMLKD